MKHALNKTTEIKDALEKQKDILSDMFWTLPYGEGMYISDTKDHLSEAEGYITQALTVIKKAEGRFEQHFENNKPEGGER